MKAEFSIVAEEGIANIKTVKTFATEKNESNRY